MGVTSVYRELLDYYRNTRKYGEEIRPGPAATEDEIANAQLRLGVRFPQELCELLREVNGDGDLLFSTDEMLEYSQYDISQNYPRGRLLFFGRDGAGNLYAYPVRDGRAEGARILLWDHESDSIDSLTPEGSSLRELIKNYYDICYSQPLGAGPAEEETNKTL